jgi:hypothetical protein
MNRFIYRAIINGTLLVFYQERNDSGQDRRKKMVKELKKKWQKHSSIRAKENARGFSMY